MLARKHKLPIQEFYKGKRSKSQDLISQPKQIVIKNNLFIIKVKDNNLKKNRFGVSVGVSVSKKATTRNFIKRNIYEVTSFFIKENKKDINIGKDVMIIVLPLVRELSKQKTKTETLKVLSGINE